MVPTHNEQSIRSPGAYLICVPPFRKWGVHKYWVVGEAEGHAGARCWIWVGWAVVGRVMVVRE